jgi:hypothetical protein
MKTPTKTLVAALRQLANDIESPDDVANAAILEAAERLDELVLQLAGRDALLNNLSKWINDLPWPTKSASLWLIRIDGVMKESPSESLRRIQAEAGGRGWLACLDWFSSDDDLLNLEQQTLKAHAEEYAERIKRGEL